MSTILDRIRQHRLVGERDFPALGNILLLAADVAQGRIDLDDECYCGMDDGSCQGCCHGDAVKLLGMIETLTGGNQ